MYKDIYLYSSKRHVLQKECLIYIYLFCHKFQKQEWISLILGETNLEFYPTVMSLLKNNTQTNPRNSNGYKGKIDICYFLDAQNQFFISL